MYMTKEILDKVLNLVIKEVDLPKSGVITSINLLAKLTVKNAGGSAWSGKMEDILNAIKEIRVVSDGNKIHYALKGTDIALMNWYDSAGKTVNLDDPVTIDAGASKTFTVLLFLDAGEIHALTKDDLAIKVDWNTSIATDVSLTDAEIKITVEKKVYESEEEYFMDYAVESEEGFEVMIVEPKVVPKEVGFDQLSELQDAVKIPIGNVLKRAFLVFKDSSGARADVCEKYALIQAKSERKELYKMDYETSRELDKVQYMLSAVPAGVTVLDYDEEITQDGFGLDTRDVDSETYKLALKTSASGKLRYISHEYVILEA